MSLDNPDRPCLCLYCGAVVDTNDSDNVAYITLHSGQSYPSHKSCAERDDEVKANLPSARERTRMRRARRDARLAEEARQEKAMLDAASWMILG